MKKNTRVIFITTLCLLGSVTAYSAYQKIEPQIRPSKENKVRLKSEAPIPEHIVYSNFFHLVVNMREQAAETARAGKGAAPMRSYFEKDVGLDQSQAAALDEIASKAVADIAAQDLKAEAVIKEFRSQFPNGRVPAGSKLPPLPSSLATLQQERNGIILAARSRLQTTLGDSGFNKVKGFVAARVANNIKPISLR